MKRVLSLALIAGALSACASMTTENAETASARSAAKFNVFPAANSLNRAEDGVALADGRIIVADQKYGLSIIEADRSVRPFGNFANAGFRHDPKTWPAAPNGVALEPDGKHILVADIHTGAIYRTDIETETTALIHQHPYAVNTAVRDSTGAIWFTQSTRNRGGEKSEVDLTKSFNTFVADGALFRIAAPTTRKPRPKPRRVLGGLCFANGIVLDEARAQLYLNESCANRVNAFRVSVKSGKLSHRRTLAKVLLPDNIEIDARGNLWVASLVRNEILMIDPDSGKGTSAFRAQSADNDQIAAEWHRRSDARQPLLDLFTPKLWAPLPGPVTGIILSPGNGPAYVSGLGNGLVKLDPRPQP